MRVTTAPVRVPTTKAAVMFKKPSTTTKTTPQTTAKSTVHPRMRRGMKRTIDSDLETNWIEDRALYDNALPELSSQVNKNIYKK